MQSPETLGGLRRRRGLMLALALLAACAAYARRYLRTVVEGHSMAPTLLPGDRLLVRRTPRGPGDRLLVRRTPRGLGDGLLVRGTRRPRPGDLVVVREPGGLEAVKRLAGRAGDSVELGSGPVRLGAGEIAVLGDRPAASTDSRHWGPLPEGALRGRVLATYHPPGRTRRW